MSERKPDRKRYTPRPKVTNAILGALVPKGDGDQSVQKRREDARALMFPERTAEWLRSLASGKSADEVALEWSESHPEEGRTTTAAVTAFVTKYIQTHAEKNAELATIVRGVQISECRKIVDTLLPKMLEEGTILPDMKLLSSIVLPFMKLGADLSGAYLTAPSESGESKGTQINIMNATYLDEASKQMAARFSKQEAIDVSGIPMPAPGETPA